MVDKQKSLLSKVWQFKEGGRRDDTISQGASKALGSNFCHSYPHTEIKVVFSIYRMTHKKAVWLQE